MSHSKKQRVTVKRRLMEFNEKYLCEKNSGLWCKLCQVSIPFEKKSSISQHLDTQLHKSLIEASKSNQKNLVFNSSNNSNRNEIKKKFGRDLMMAFASANIPVNKLENQQLRKNITKYLKPEVENCWPSSTTVRKSLEEIHETETVKLKESFKQKKIAIFADETTDSQQRYVLNVLILELDYFKRLQTITRRNVFSRSKIIH